MCHKDDSECESFTVISIDYLIEYESKYYLQVYLDNCANKFVNKQMSTFLTISYNKFCIMIELL